jgi:hypothetical protein
MGVGGGSREWRRRRRRRRRRWASINQIHQEHTAAVASEWMCVEGQLERSDPPPEK